MVAFGIDSNWVAFTVFFSICSLVQRLRRFSVFSVLRAPEFGGSHLPVSNHFSVMESILQEDGPCKRSNRRVSFDYVPSAVDYQQNVSMGCIDDV